MIAQIVFGPLLARTPRELLVVLVDTFDDLAHLGRHVVFVVDALEEHRTEFVAKGVTITQRIDNGLFQALKIRRQGLRQFFKSIFVLVVSCLGQSSRDHLVFGFVVGFFFIFLVVTVNVFFAHEHGHKFRIALDILQGAIEQSFVHHAVSIICRVHCIAGFVRFR